MARAIWTGSLSFGLVNVPVGLFSATEDRTVHFNQFQAGTSDRIRNKRVNERTGEDVDYADIVKGYDVGGGEYVVVTPAELEAVEPGRSRTIDIEDFVDLHDVDPIYFERPYYLAPQGEGAQKAYALLRRAMLDSGKAGIATLVLRGKQYLVSIRADQHVLVLETMRFADEVRDPRQELDTLPEDGDFSSRELDAAKLLVESMAAAWEPGRYHDTYRERVEELIETKRRGEQVVVETARAAPAPVVDLMAALQASVDEARGRRTGATVAGRAAAGRAAAGRTVASGAVTRGATTEKRAAGRAEPATSRRQRRNSAGPEGAEAAGRRGSAGQAAPDDLAELTKAELYDRAGVAGVAGRSKMTRDELLAALREETSGSRRRRAS